MNNAGLFFVFNDPSRKGLEHRGFVTLIQKGSNFRGNSLTSHKILLVSLVRTPKTLYLCPSVKHTATAFSLVGLVMLEIGENRAPDYEAGKPV